MSALQLQIVRPAARTGLKGPAAAALLERIGIAIPPRANQFVAMDAAGVAGLRCLRLGHSEFLLEHDEDTRIIDAVRSAATGTRAHLAPRCDFSCVLGGDGLFDHLATLCAFDFALLEDSPSQVVMTLIAGVSVTFVLETAAGARPALRLWSDPSFGTYLTQCLVHPGDHR